MVIIINLCLSNVSRLGCMSVVYPRPATYLVYEYPHDDVKVLTVIGYLLFFFFLNVSIDYSLP